MPGNRPPLLPEPDTRGLAGEPPTDVAALLAPAWDGLIDMAGRLDLDAPSRLEDWTVRDVLVHLGSWDEHEVFATLLDDARHDRVHDVDDADARNAHVIAAHHDAALTDITAALATARDRAVEFLASPDAVTVGRDWTASVAGPLPVTGVLVASGFELAVHALDVAAPSEVPTPLLDAGVAALVDLAGALAARRRLDLTVAVVIPSGGWVTGSAGGSWTTMPLPPGSRARDLGWPAVEGLAADVIDAAAGRRLAAQLVVTRRLRLYDLPALLRLTGAIEEVHGLPGGSALRTTSRALAQTAQLLGRLGGRMGDVVRRQR